MTLSSKPEDEVKKATELESATTDLRDRWDEDFAKFRLDSDQYKIPEAEGEWDTFITNRAASEGNKIIDVLSFARCKLWIPLADETAKNRKSLTATEQLAIGCIDLADSLIEDIPEGVDIQSSLVFYRVIRGWSAQRVMIYKDGDKVIPDIAVWDPRNTFWMTGRNRLVWACYRRYATKDQVEDEYPGWNGTVGDNGVITIYNVLSPTQEGVIIGNEYVKPPTDHGLDYVPVRIKAGRSTPLVHDEKNTDNIKMVGESYLANNRNMLKIESRLLSYHLTRAGQLAKSPRVVEFNGELSEGKPPASFTKDPYIKGRTLYLDTSKGQKLAENLVPPKGSEIESALAITVGLESIGGLSPVAYGQINQALPAQGIDMLTHATMDVVKPYKRGVERDMIWIAEELVRQYANGDFGTMELEGYDKSSNKFKAKISPKNIDSNWRFECDLIPDLLRDKNMNIGMAAQAVMSKLMSKQTARDQFNLVEDTDLEQEKIDREDAEQIAQVKLWKMLVGLVKDGNMLEAQIVLNTIMSMAQPSGPQGPGGSPPGGGAPVRGINRPVQPGATNRAIQVPPEISNAARLHSIGLVAGNE